MKTLVIITVVVLVIMTIPLIALALARAKFIKGGERRRVQEAELRAQLEQTMETREKLIWFDKPDPEREFSKVSSVVVLFAVVWTMFSVTWTAIASGALYRDLQCDAILLMFGFPASMFGIYALWSPYWMIKQATHTTYVLTNTRAIAVCEGQVRTLVKYTDPSFGPIKVEPYEQNLADVLFYEEVDSEGHKSAKGFFGLKDPQFVLGLLGSKVKSATRQPLAEICDKL